MENLGAEPEPEQNPTLWRALSPVLSLVRAPGRRLVPGGEWPQPETRRAPPPFQRLTLAPPPLPGALSPGRRRAESRPAVGLVNAARPRGGYRLTNTDFYRVTATSRLPGARALLPGRF
ncbi:hypothetical protein EYF80_060829 [Liparis tanakae]|uniref:Uncharacterized protein n=1 Tax=Liparis tanakae TaxID=230148 RepID=A0A4Z2EKN9_9TELE|nr:hypothetical protein EYF80_060829 [Liparis tanakae]